MVATPKYIPGAPANKCGCRNGILIIEKTPLSALSDIFQ
jgi:hypothetical protein